MKLQSHIVNGPGGSIMGFAVNLWGSHPNEGNDDCWTSVAFPTLEAARAAAASPATFPFPQYAPSRSVAALQVVTEDESENVTETHEVTMNPAFKPRRDDDREWRREMQMEAGMLHGCDGFNEYEGM